MDVDPTIADAALLADQIAYYRARASEYDEWWFRTGRFDRGAEANAAWFSDVAETERALETFLARERPRTVLELACGTGLHTRLLAPRVGHVTAVDASPEVIACNRARVASANVDYLEADAIGLCHVSNFPGWCRRIELDLTLIIFHYLLPLEGHTARTGESLVVLQQLAFLLELYNLVEMRMRAAHCPDESRCTLWSQPCFFIRAVYAIVERVHADAPGRKRGANIRHNLA